MDKDQEQPIRKDVTYYKDLTVKEGDGAEIAIKNVEISCLKLEHYEGGKKLLWFYLKGIGKVDTPLVVSGEVNIQQMIDFFMRKE